MKINPKLRYSQEIVLEVFDLLNKGLQIRKIEKIVGVPETTIRNWKYGYTGIFYPTKKIKGLEPEVRLMIGKGLSMAEIAKKLKIDYDEVRLFLKNELSQKEYKKIKVVNPELPKKAKVLSPELAYILGVMYGDGHFGKGQIKLGTKDKDFLEYFVGIAEKWCGKIPSLSKNLRKNNKPYFECYLTWKKAKEFIGNLVKKRKKIPEIILKTKNKKIKTMFIKGFSDSEGFIGKSGPIILFNCNMVVLDQIRRLFLNLGFDKNKVKIALNNQGVNKPVYSLRISTKKELRKFYLMIGFTIQRKQKRLENCMVRWGFLGKSL